MAFPAAGLIAALAPWLWAGLKIFILANIVGFVVRLVIALGLYFYVVQPAGDAMLDVLQGRVGLLPPEVVAWVGYLNIDRFLSLVFSAAMIVMAANFVLRHRGQ